MFYEYFLEPILSNGWFNPVNTITYGIVLVVAVFLVYKLLIRMKIGIDRNFFIAVLPFIFWASSTRVLHDAAFSGALTGALGEFYNMPVFPTPGSYIITFAFALFSLLASLIVQKYTKVQYYKTMFLVGLAGCIWNVSILPVATFIPFLIIVPVTLLLTLVVSLPALLWRTKTFRKLSPGDSIRKLFSPENTGILSAHLLDATATVTALELFGYLEQHVVPRLFFDLFGTFSMFFLKILVVLPVLWMIDRYADEGNFRNFLKIVVLILGLAPGLRDLIRLMALV